jgi:hypothetical protein
MLHHAALIYRCQSAMRCRKAGRAQQSHFEHPPVALKLKKVHQAPEKYASSQREKRKKENKYFQASGR